MKKYWKGLVALVFMYFPVYMQFGLEGMKWLSSIMLFICGVLAFLLWLCEEEIEDKNEKV